MIDWILDDPHRANNAAMCVVIAVLALGIYLGRKRLAVTLPVAALFFLVAAVNIPSVDWGNRVSDQNKCINNLRWIEAAKTEWAKVNHQQPTDVPTEQDLCGTNASFHQYFACPSGGQYAIGSVNADPKCSLAARGHRLP